MLRDTEINLVYIAFDCRYQEALLSLVSNMLNKLQFRYNQSQLEELDDEVLDDDVGSSYCPQFMNFVWIMSAF